MPLEIYNHTNHAEYSKPELIHALHGVAREINSLRIKAKITHREELEEFDATTGVFMKADLLTFDMVDSRPLLNIIQSVVGEQCRNYDKAVGGVDPNDIYFPSILFLDDESSNLNIAPDDWLMHQPVLGGIAVSVDRLITQLDQAKNAQAVKKIMQRLHTEYFTGLMYINRGYGFDEQGFKVFGSTSYLYRNYPQNNLNRDERQEVYEQGEISVIALYSLHDAIPSTSEIVEDATIDLANKWLHRLASYQYSEDKQAALALFSQDIKKCGLAEHQLTVIPPISLVSGPENERTMCCSINPKYLVINPIIFKTTFSRDEEKIGSNILDMFSVLDARFLYAVRDIFFSNDLDIAQALENRSVNANVLAFYKEFDWIWNYPVQRERHTQLKILQKKINQVVVLDLLEHLNASKK